MDHWSPQPLSSLRHCRSVLARATCAVGFWASVLLPFAYVGIVLSDLPEAGVPAVAVVHAVSLYAGHEHAPRDGHERRPGRTRGSPDRETVWTAGGDD